MGLGPAYCKNCLTLMGLNPTDSKRYWGCETCHTDDMEDNCGHLFLAPPEDVKVIFKDDPEFLKWYEESFLKD